MSLLNVPKSLALAVKAIMLLPIVSMMPSIVSALVPVLSRVLRLTIYEISPNRKRNP